MAANMVYENEATSERHYEGIHCRDLSEGTNDRNATGHGTTIEYYKLQRRPKWEPCGNISRRSLILRFLVAIVVSNVAVGVTVWYIPRITGCSYPDEATCTLCPISTENNRSSTNRTKKACDADWEYYSATDYCYRAFTDPMPFFQAERHCVSHGAHLASSRSPAEHIIVKGLSPTPDGYWLGGTDFGEEGVWHWVEGEPIGPWKAWNPGQPSGTYGVHKEDCMNIPSTKSGWNDISCSSKLGFICSKPAENA